jgi:APA family basic amino acid/polyamine antiporter
MVVEFIAALLIFGIGGTANSDPKLLTPLFPLGLGAVIMAAIPAYYSFTGFMVIAEIGEEIKNPSINIPRTLLISFFVVLIAYTLVPMAVTGILSWDSLADTQGAVAVASEIIFPEWLAKVIALSALFAIATSINGIIVAQSRDIFAVARDRVLPTVLTKVSKTFKAPYYAIIMIGALPLIGVAMGASIKNYAIMTVLGFMIFQILAGIVVLRLPKILPERYEAAQFKLKGFARPFFSIGLILISILFIILGIKESPVPSLIYLILVILGILVYKLRKNYLQNKGLYLEEMLTKDLSGII